MALPYYTRLEIDALLANFQPSDGGSTPAPNPEPPEGGSVLYFDNKSLFPSVGEVNNLYVDNSDGVIYTWNVELNDYKEEGRTQIQSDFEEFNIDSPAYIRNKPEMATRPFISRWSVAAGETIQLPINEDVFHQMVVDWGDGTSNRETSHTYADAGVYDISIKGRMDDFRFQQIPTSRLNITEIVQWGDIEWREVNFHSCSNLATLPINDSPDFLKATRLNVLFRGCALTSLPSALLKRATTVTSLLYAFRGNQLTQLPADLLDNCVNVTNYQSTFRENQITSLPVGLFKNSYSAVSFHQTFESNALTSVDGDTFKNCISAVTFEETFGNNQITTIGTGLFDDCTTAKNFKFTFRDNLIEYIPEELFYYTIFATDFNSTFVNNSLIDIPDTLFDYTPRVKTFYETFRHNGNTLTGTAPEVWIKYPNVAIHTAMFEGAINLTNYADIPTDWKQ